MTYLQVRNKAGHTSLLSNSTRTFLIILCLNGIANSLSNIFVNIFLFKVSQNLYEVALFNFVSYVVWMPAFLFAGILSKKIERKLCIIIGSVLQLVFYLCIIGLGKTSVDMLIPLGLIFGIGSGFYWLSVNVLTVDYTNDNNRDWFNALNGIFHSISQMIGPLTAGWIVVMFPGFMGYKTIFALSFLFFLASMFFTFFLPNTTEKSSFDYKSMFAMYGHKEWRYIAYVFSSLAFRDGVLSFIIWIWVYMVTKSEGQLGNYAFITTGFSIITFYLIGRFGRQEQKWSFIVWGSVFLSLSIFILVYKVNYITLLVYGLTSAICIPLFQIPFNTLSLNSISKFDENGKLRIEMVVSRELALSAGRIPSVGCVMLIYFLSKNPEAAIPYFMALIILIGLTSIYFLREYKHTL
ncbi:MFS transporter [Neobacillus ginsengisoli]|uniref:YQGE family putative transporter n=1 Tax=Neobacillus ginsengisoli TaxID=904295 RepID=A0ABT9XWY9_9BACI|nr:MFS transporter [Neobacillus ginsengisoli]MDQ0199846.1 YQGE family putative transporter [Neobacillus ginsengisoli]